MLEKVGSVSDFKEGQGRTIRVAGKDIAVFNVHGKIYAISNVCAHRGGPLGEGELDGNVVTCPWHGWKYNVETGVSPLAPSVSVPRFSVAIKDGDVFIEV